jgi:hypothetical protein
MWWETQEGGEVLLYGCMGPIILFDLYDSLKSDFDNVAAKEQKENKKERKEIWYGCMRLRFFEEETRLSVYFSAIGLNDLAPRKIK